MPHPWRLLPADPAGYARDLYDALREFDHLGLELIVVEAPPPDPGWNAVQDRLRRAAVST